MEDGIEDEHVVAFHRGVIAALVVVNVVVGLAAAVDYSVVLAVLFTSVLAGLFILVAEADVEADVDQ